MKIYILSKKTLVIFLILILAFVGLLIYCNRFTGYLTDIRSVFSTQKQLPIYSVETREKEIAISFDAAWGDTYTDDILDVLDEYNVKTTFFLVGFWVDKYPDMVKKIHQRGHEIGNHSSSHPHMSQLTREEI